MGGGPSELNLWWRIGAFVVGVVFRLLFKLRYLRADRIPPSGPAILAANHLSMLDGAALGLAVATRRRRVIRFLAAAEFFAHPFLGPFLRLYGQIPIRRGAGDTHALDEAVETIRSGALAGIFPEGRTNVGTELQRGRTGVARLALGAGVPVVPVGIWGTQVRWPRAGIKLRRPLRPPVVLAFGEPIQPQGDPSSPDDLQTFTDLVMERLALVVEEARAAAG